MYFNEVLKKENIIAIKKVLLKQKEGYDFLKTKTFDNMLFSCVKNNKLILPANTLVHGTNFDFDVLKEIKKDGILASEFSKKQNDFYDETFYMADFFKNITDQDLTIEELLHCHKEHTIAYLPGSKEVGKNKIAFIVNPNNKTIQEYLKLDLFSESNGELLSFIDEEMYFSISRRKRLYQYDYKLGQSSIPIGVPYSALSGIIIDKTLEENKNGELNELKNLFGGELFIVSEEGIILHTPELNKEEEVTM